MSSTNEVNDSAKELEGESSDKADSDPKQKPKLLDQVVENTLKDKKLSKNQQGEKLNSY